MTNQQLFQKIMNYEAVDRLPVFHWGIWTETRQRWLGEGLPDDVDVNDFLGAAPYFINIGGVNNALYPAFPREILEETDEYRVVRDTDGVTRKEFKQTSSIPQEIDCTFKTAAEWPEYKARLQPHPDRVQLNDQWQKQFDKYRSPLRLCCGSLIGRLRNYMGVENMIYLIYDSPEILTDYVQTAADLACWLIDEVVGRQQIPVDCVQLWEDICGSTGPLIRPEDFRTHVAPGYAQIRSTMDKYGIRHLAVDCDGVIDPLLPAWLDAGVNILYPLEIGTWKADPHSLRKEYGRDLRIIGGYDKLVLEKDRAAIDAELERRMPLIKEGGYIPMPDHLITPDTPLENYQYYLDRLREVRL